MSTNLHPLMAAALAPFAPPLSGLHKPEPVEYRGKLLRVVQRLWRGYVGWQHLPCLQGHG